MSKKIGPTSEQELEKAIKTTIKDMFEPIEIETDKGTFSIPKAVLMPELVPVKVDVEFYKETDQGLEKVKRMYRTEDIIAELLDGGGKGGEGICRKP